MCLHHPGAGIPKYMCLHHLAAEIPKKEGIKWEFRKTFACASIRRKFKSKDVFATLYFLISYPK